MSAHELKEEMFEAIKQECLKIYDSKEEPTVSHMLIHLMSMEGVPMHYPYHHFIMPATLLTLAALETDKSRDELEEELSIALDRAKAVPGGFCGNCGSCGNGVGVGIFASVYSKASPTTRENWKLSNEAAGRALLAISEYPGPRCCKRTAFLAVQDAVPFFNERLGLNLKLDEKIECTFHNKNAECLEDECPFFNGEKK